MFLVISEKSQQKWPLSIRLRYSPTDIYIEGELGEKNQLIP